MQTHTSDTRKPAFRWLGPKPKSDAETAGVLEIKDSKKRMFGTEITNILQDRSRGSLSIDKDQDCASELEKRARILTSEANGSKLKDSRQSQNYHFGPFAPIDTSKGDAPKSRKMKQPQDWDSLASKYRPQYQNQGTTEPYLMQLKDNVLLDHMPTAE